MDSDVKRICRAVFGGDLDVGTATARLKEHLRGGKRSEASLLVSCTLFALWDLCDNDDAARQSRLALLAKELYQNGSLDEDVWLSTAEWDLLEASQTVGSVTDDKRREVRFYTRVVYVQTRFNLASECPTGFARLFSVLQRMTVDPVEKLKADLCRLVGELKIEPHRVLDALLEFMPTSAHPSHKLMTLFDRNKAAHLMGRKLQSEKVPTTELPEVDRRPDKLMRTTRLGRGDDLRVAKELSQGPGEKRTANRYFLLCATLEVEGYLDTALVFPYLSPSLKETRERTNEFLKGIQAAAEEQRHPNLNRPLPETRSRMTEKDKDVHSVYRDPKKFSYMPERVMEMEASALTTNDPFPRLAAAFLETSQPGKGLRMMRALGDVFCPEVTKGCLSVVERLLEPFIQRIPVRSMDQFMEDVKTPLFSSLRACAPAVFEWLAVTGYRLHLNMELFRKAALVMMHELRFYGHPSYSETMALVYPAPKKHSVEYMISTVFLPALLVMDVPLGLDAAAWIDGLVKMCTYSVRVMVFIHFEEFVSKSAILDRCVVMAETAARNLIKILVTAQDPEAFETNVIPIVDGLGQIAIRAPYHVTQMMVEKVKTDVMAAKDLSTAMLFFTPLAFSAFSHHFVLKIISTGSGCKHDDGHISQWYKNTLTLLGHVAHDYPETLPLHFILQNILKEISNTEVIHVHILKELVHSMTGFQHCSEIGNSQFATLSGGPMLKSIGLVTPWQKDESGYNASAIALKRTLAMLPRNDRPNPDGLTLTLGGQMFVLLAKFLDYIPIRGDFAQVSSIMEMHSTVLGTFLAFVEFLSVYCTACEYTQMLPSMGYVLNELKLPMHYVAHLYRPSIVEMRVIQGGIKKHPVPMDSNSVSYLQNVIQQLQQTRPMDVDMEDTDNASETPQLVKALERSGLADVDPSLFQKYGMKHVRLFYDFMEELSQNEAFIAMHVWDVMSPEFYTFFWSMKLNDITISDTEYRKRMKQIQDEISGQEHENRSETTLNQLEHKLAALRNERESYQTHVKFCREFIRSRQAHLLAHLPTEKLRSFVDAFVQLCLYPRIRLGHEDALFAFEFVLIMTKMGVPNFPTLFILDKVVKELFPCLICMTDNEAEGFANFMYEFLRQMERWRAYTMTFRKEFGLLPGALEDPYTPGTTELVTHSNFLKVMAKWFNVIARLLKECLRPPESEERRGGEVKDSVKHRRIMRRPALLVLDRLIPIFPTLTGLAKHLLAALQYVKQHDKDEGMKTSAFTALERLNAEMANAKPGRWLELDAYNISPKDPDPSSSQTAPNEMTHMEIEDVMEIENEGKKDDAAPETAQEPLKDEMDEEAEEGMIPGSHKEEGELDKGTRRGRPRKQPEEQAPRTRKRMIGKPDSSSGELYDASRRGSGRDDVKRKREGIQRAESEKDQRRTKGTRSYDTRRKP